jgi:hypothetical protein
MKGTIHQEEISILNIYTPNTGAPIYIKKCLMVLHAQTDPITVIVGDLNTSPSKDQQRNFRTTPHIRPNRYG